MRRSTFAFTVVALAVAAVAPATSFALSKPPLPRVIAADGMHEHAARGSYCWTSRHSAICADTTDPIRYARTLRVPAGTSQVIRMRYPVTALSASNGGGRALELEPIGSGRRSFRLTIDRPSRPRVTAVYLSADYGRTGDGLFAIRIRPRN